MPYAILKLYTLSFIGDICKPLNPELGLSTTLYQS